MSAYNSYLYWNVTTNPLWQLFLEFLRNNSTKMVGGAPYSWQLPTGYQAFQLLAILVLHAVAME